MSVARVAVGALLGALALPLACGERAGDPVVWLVPPGDGTGGSAGTGGAAARAGTGTGASSATPTTPMGGEAFGGDTSEGSSSSGGARPDPIPEAGPVGLCGSCTESGECGDANDACIRHQGQRFCGRDCDDQRRCPESYSCVELDNSQLWQCVPQTECPAPTVEVPPLVDIREHILARINAERALREQAPLQGSTCLDTLAQGSAVAFARTDEPLGKFVKECDPVWPNCACGWTAEAEITIARYALDWRTAVDVATTVREDQNTRFTQAFLEFNVTDVGIGFWLSGDEAWIALSFH